MKEERSNGRKKKNKEGRKGMWEGKKEEEGNERIKEKGKKEIVLTD